MKKAFFLSILALAAAANLFGQALDFTFTAKDNSAYVRIDSVKAMNRTAGGETTIHWPDTTLSMNVFPGDTLLFVGYATGYPVGMQEQAAENGRFQLFPVTPNPVGTQGMIRIYLPQAGVVQMAVTNVQGRILARLERGLGAGYHAFLFSPGTDKFCLITARWNSETRTVKVLSTDPAACGRCRLEYATEGNQSTAAMPQSGRSGMTMLESGILDTPQDNKTYSFQFATNIPCPGMPTVDYEGQVYHTIQIFSQCWFKENLNVGYMIPGTSYQTNNGTKEKHCYSNSPDSCTKYGGLYMWDEVMQYDNTPGGQGICPAGWHIPTDEEWKVLEGAVDSQFGIGDPEWDRFNISAGLDAGRNLKFISGWNVNGSGTDRFGFSSLPGGKRNTNGPFDMVGFTGFWWSSTDYDAIVGKLREIWYYTNTVGRKYYHKYYGFSVRCIRNN